MVLLKQQKVSFVDLMITISPNHSAVGLKSTLLKKNGNEMMTCVHFFACHLFITMAILGSLNINGGASQSRMLQVVNLFKQQKLDVAFFTRNPLYSSIAVFGIE